MVLASEPDDATEEIHRRLLAVGERVGLTTVYRTLSTLAAAGVVDELAHRRGESCYRLCGPGHHHHLVCTGCHRVIEVTECDLDGWLRQLARAHDFEPTEHRLEVLGLCHDCRPLSA